MVAFNLVAIHNVTYCHSTSLTLSQLSHFDYTITASLTTITVTSIIVHSKSHTVQHNYITKHTSHQAVITLYIKSIKAMPLALHKIYHSQNICIHFPEHWAQSFNNQQFVPNFPPKLLDSCILLYTYLTTATGSKTIKCFTINNLL